MRLGATSLSATKPGSTRKQVTSAAAATGWDINNATYVKTSNITVANVNGYYVRGLTFKPDGTEMYVVTSSNHYTRIYQYNLSTPWDINTLSADSHRRFTQDRGFSISFKPDGIRYFLASDDEDRIQEYDLDTAWDIDGGETLNSNTSFQTLDNRITSCQFNSDGTKAVLYGTGNDKLYYHTLSTAWDISTASHSTTSGVLANNPYNMVMKPDGTKFYLIGSSKIYQHNATTAFDMSTVSTSPTYTINVNDDVSISYVSGIALSPDGSKMYTINSGTKDVYQYSL